MEEVKKGYKVTEFGWIPKNWELNSLNTICDVRDGTHASPKYQQKGVKFVTSKNIVDGKVDFSDISYISKHDAIEIDKRSKVEKNDILLSMIGTIGNCAIVDFEPDFSIKNVALIKPIKINPKFLAQYLSSKRFEAYLKNKLAGGIQKFVSLSVLRGLEIPVPPLHEQKAIATALSDVDALIHKLDELIEKKQNIKKATMQLLLTGKQRLDGFDGEWEEKEFSQFGEIVTGSTPSTYIDEYWNGHIPWVTPTDIQESRDISNTEREITELGLSQVRALPPNSLAITCIASIGKNAILRQRGATNQQINAIVPYDEYDSIFLYYLIENNKNLLMSKAGITATNIISKKEFSKLSIKVPQYSEQLAISEIISAMDDEIEALHDKIAKYSKVKKGMMQELLTGKTRLV